MPPLVSESPYVRASLVAPALDASPAADCPRHRGVHELVAEQAARTPGATAIICAGRRFTYARLDAGANRIAHFLGSRGVGPGGRVLVCLDRSPEMLQAVLGVLKAGAAYVPLDPDSPRARLAAVLGDARPALLLSQQDVASRLGLRGAQVVCLDAARAELARAGDRAPAVPTAPDDPAYVLCTSGSTDEPRGVTVSHGAAVNRLCSVVRRPGLTAEDTLLAVTALALDAAFLELFGPLLVGARVALATREEAADGGRLLALLAASGATVLQATPATWRLLLEAGWEGPTGLKVLCGDEALPRDLTDELLARSASVWDMYRLAGTTVWSAAGPVPPGPAPAPVTTVTTTFYAF